MAIGINDLDFDDDEYGLESMNDTTTQDIDPYEPPTPEPPSAPDPDGTTDPDLIPELDDRGIISEFLKSRGIEDISKIKYEGEEYIILRQNDILAIVE